MTPLAMQWSGSAMYPLHPKIADRQYVVGAIYTLAPWEDRSGASHAHEFGWLAEAWHNLPEHLADLYPTQTHLRKRALIEAGFYDEQIVNVGTKTGAQEVAKFVRYRDDFAVVLVRGPIVIVRTAKSQSRRAMNRQEFARSKSAIMEVVANLIGVTPAALNRERAA